MKKRDVIGTMLAVASCGLLATACASSASAPDGDPTPLGTSASPIVNGQLDTTRQAVVMVGSQQANAASLCTGTFIKIDPTTGVGWLLSAAHCFRAAPEFVVQGDDYTAKDAIVYSVLDYEIDPRWGGSTASPYDVAVVRVLGVTAKTPTMPYAKGSDGLGVGSKVVDVGYGITTNVNVPDDNSRRRNYAATLSSVTQTMITANNSGGGVCQGDSGGPTLAMIGGVETIVGIHSYVSGGCVGNGASSSSGRVILFTDFIERELGKPLPERTCDLCARSVSSGLGACAMKSRECLADAECQAYAECRNKCVISKSCLEECKTKHPLGVGPFVVASSLCTCKDGCAAECGGSSLCTETPKCGAPVPDGACGTCSESSCCDELAACTADGECYACMANGDADPACSSNPLRAKVSACVSGKCATECAGTAIGGDADAGADGGADEDEAAGAAPTTTTTTSSCGCSTVGDRAADARVGLAAGLAMVVAGLARRRRRAA